MRKALAFLFVIVCCASQSDIAVVQVFHDTDARGDDAATQAYVVPGARMWFDKREGAGVPLLGGPWRHWDLYFHGHTRFTNWESHDHVVTAIGHETNDYYRLLDWKPAPFRMTWWLDGAGKITGVLLEPTAGKSASRLDDFRAWVKQKHPDELEYLMPGGNFDPTGDRPERWRALLLEWRREAGLPSVQ
jgi:hypothetical protein